MEDEHQVSRLADLTGDEQYRLLVESISDYAIYMLDASGRVASWNQGAYLFKGYKAAEIIGHHFSRFYTEEDRAAGLPNVTLNTAAHEGRFEGEGWRVRKDGSRFWAHVVVDPIRSQSGDLIGYAKITRDFTERHLAREELKRSEEQFRLLVQGVSDYAIYMIDRDGMITSWNLGAQRIKGYLSGEIIGQHFSCFYTEADREAGEPQRALETAIREGKYEKQALRVRKDGTQFWANVVIDPIRNDDGEIIAFAKVTRDITEQQKAQAAIEKAHEALFQSQKMEAIGQLSGGIAHDFNNLLMAVSGSLQLIRKRLAYDPRISPLVDNALQASERGTSLTRRLLAFARRQELELQAVNVPSMVIGMKELLQRSLGPGSMVETHFDLGVKAAKADMNQLELALLNLVVNARDAMPGGGHIVISARREVLASGNHVHLAPGAYLCLAVTDTGHGMDEQMLAKAREPFFTTKGVGKGTGLGLSMVHGMAEQLGGRLHLISKVGEGTTAEIWLPEAENLGAIEDEPTIPKASSELKMPRLHVLAVDDDPLVLLNTAAMLEELGHTVSQAVSGRDALAIIRGADPIDLVITDEAMPGMSGSELAHIVSLEQPHIPFVIATGYADLSPLTAMHLPKLSKPFSEHDLVEVLTSPAVQSKLAHIPVS